MLQTYLAFREPIFSPVDELQHTDYVRTIAEEGRLPIYGRSNVDLTLLAVYMHEYPAPFSPNGYILPPYVFAEYEAIQFPLYYVFAAPLYRALDRDPRAAIYGLRLENVALSAALLVVMMLTVGRVFPRRPEVAAAAPLVILLIPGVSLRHSQVTNQVLAALLLAVLLALLLQRGEASAGRLAFAEGVLFGAAIMTKLTVIGAGPTVIAAWATRKEGLRSRLLPGAAGVAVALLPWLAWSGVTYHFPLPWVTTPTNFQLCDCPAPGDLQGWTKFAHDVWVDTVLPYEWAGTAMTCPTGPTACIEVTPRTVLMRVALAVFGLFMIVAFAWSLWMLRNRGSPAWRPMLLAWLAIAGVILGIVGLEISASRFAGTDLREAYVFAAPVALVVAGFVSRIDRRVMVPLVVGILLMWLAVDYQMYAMSSVCPGCPPNLFNHQ